MIVGFYVYLGIFVIFTSFYFTYVTFLILNKIVLLSGCKSESFFFTSTRKSAAGNSDRLSKRKRHFVTLLTLCKLHHNYQYLIVLCWI